ncbi:unnamed protein product [Ilex paraguariensis]|uniref:Uncharacterized protein n=1 Tax=Ilex paraguariensis TaxID=185542 RepID=A0ABC8V512_9AQUA
MNLCSCSNLKLLNVSASPLGSFSPAVATWYGSAHGAGSGGGACGYGPGVGQPPYSAMVSAGNANLFKSGKGCGSCYQVKCTQNAACSRNPVTVTITDECPGSCNDELFHFDLSGKAFGAMAKPGQDGKLRSAGKLNIQYQKVPCNYPGVKVAFRVGSGSNPNFFACAIEYEDGDGDLALVELHAASSNQWLPMQQSWGATWKINLSPATKAPFSIRLTTVESRKSIVANNVIPTGWSPGQTYRSVVNF